MYVIYQATYFVYDWTVVQQTFKTAIAIATNFYMEKLEQNATMTAPAECKPNMRNTEEHSSVLLHLHETVTFSVFFRTVFAPLVR